MPAKPLEDQGVILRESLKEGAGKTDLLNPVCCFTVTSDEGCANEKSPSNFPPAISVIVDPPSPSMSIESHHDPFGSDGLEGNLRRYSGGNMEKCKSIYNAMYNSNERHILLNICSCN